MALYFITGNEDKFKEVAAIIDGIEQYDIDIPEIQELDSQKIIAAKLQEAGRHHEGAFIVEDTSLSLIALSGLPGPLIKWFLKTIGNEGLSEIASRANEYHAEAKTTIGYMSSNGDIHYFEGSLQGEITTPRGNNGFGWDKIFIPEGHTRTLAEMNAEEKNSISMRGEAARKLALFLNTGAI